VAAALCFFFGNTERLDSIKAGLTGFEAKTREAETVLNQAKATVASLQKLAVATASFQVYELAGAGRFGESVGKPKDEQKARLLERLRGIVTDDQLAEVDGADRKFVIIDYVLLLLQPFAVWHAGPADPAKDEAYRHAVQREPPLTPDECRSLLNEFGLRDDKADELLKDYQYYLDTGKQRRPEVWHNRY
jgi:hypothetical protein